MATTRPSPTLPDGWTEAWGSMSSPAFITWMRDEGITAPHVELLGYRTAGIEPGRSELTWSVPTALLNPVGIAHGGFLAAILDDAAGIAAASTFARWVPMLTVHLNVDYIAPVAPGIEHRVTGTVVRPGRTSLLSDAEIRDPDGRLLARGSGVFQPNRRVIPKDRWADAGLA